MKLTLVVALALSIFAVVATGPDYIDLPDSAETSGDIPDTADSVEPNRSIHGPCKCDEEGNRIEEEAYKCNKGYACNCKYDEEKGRYWGECCKPGGEDKLCRPDSHYESNRRSDPNSACGREVCEEGSGDLGECEEGYRCSCLKKEGSWTGECLKKGEEDKEDIPADEV